MSDSSHANSSPSLPTSKSKIYTGRFAPSPTGPLHFGSLIAATASYLCARQQSGQWLLRIEDVDTQRERKGASQSIIQTLEDFGFEWDGDILFQSQHTNHYEKALTTIENDTFFCTCTRKFLRAEASSEKFGYIYPGFCRDSSIHQLAQKGGGVLSSIRVRSDISRCRFSRDFEELCQPKSIKQDIEKDVGDFILKRRDGLFAYQLAVVVDDEFQGITDIVRGADLFDNTPRQNYLQCLLGYHQPRYLHFPVAVDISGKKFSKHNLPPQISVTKKRSELLHALEFLGQSPPPENEFSSIDDIWKWAVQNWDIKKIPKTLTKTVTTDND